MGKLNQNLLIPSEKDAILLKLILIKEKNKIKCKTFNKGFENKKRNLNQEF